MKLPSWLDKLANNWGYIKSVSLSALGNLNLPAWPFNKTFNYLEAYKSWVFAAVNARSADVASFLKLHLYRTKTDGSVEEVKDHEALSLLRMVNPWLTMRQLWKYTQAYRDLSGEAFWYLVRAGANGRGKIIQIWLLRPDWVSIKTDSSKFITGYQYRVPGQGPIDIAAEDIIQFKNFNPLDVYRGLSIVRAAAVTVDAEGFAEEYNRKFFQNSAIPSVILSTEQKLDANIIKRMKEQWANEYSGPDKAHKMAILEGGLELKPFQTTQAEMQFLEGQAFSRDKVLALFEVPKSRLGMTEGITVSNAQATEQIYLKYTVKNLLSEMTDVINEFLLPNYSDGENLFFDFEDPVPENEEAVTNRFKNLFSIGAISPNEIRQQLGLDEVDGLDGFYIPINITEVIGGGEEMDEPIKGPRTRKLKVKAPPPTLKQKITREISSKVAKGIIEAISKDFKKNQEQEQEEKLGKSKFTEAQQEALWKAFVDKSEHYEQEYIGELQKIFARQKGETIGRLESTQKALRRSQIGEVLFSLPEENKVSAQVLVPLLEQFLEEAGQDALDSLGLSEEVFDTTAANVRAFFKQDALKGIKSMNRVTKAKLRKELAEGVAKGEGIPELTKRVQNVFEEASRARAMKIARTEVIRAGNRGALEAYKQSGVVAGKQWFTALDERVCEWCAPMQGRVKALDSNFFYQGESFMGKEGHTITLDYADIAEPPLHPLCRCTLVPITLSGARATLPGIPALRQGQQKEK